MVPIIWMASPATTSLQLLGQQLGVGRLGDIAGHIHRLPATLTAPQGHMAVGVAPGGSQAPPGCPENGPVPARRAGQGLVVSVRKNKLQGLMGPVLLDPSPSHRQTSGFLGTLNLPS